MRLPRDLHPVAWWVWAVGLAVAASCTTNPLLLAVLLGVITLVVLTCRSDQPWARSFRLYVWLGVVVIAVRILFRVLLGGDVPGHVLFTLPSVPLPEWAAGISLLGPFTREELLAASYEGLRLATLLIAVGAANALANPKRLMKSLPPALYEIGTAMTVAISVVPQLADSARRVRTRRVGVHDPQPRELAARPQFGQELALLHRWPVGFGYDQYPPLPRNRNWRHRGYWRVWLVPRDSHLLAERREPLGVPVHDDGRQRVLARCRHPEQSVTADHAGWCRVEQCCRHECGRHSAGDTGHGEPGRLASGHLVRSGDLGDGVGSD